MQYLRDEADDKPLICGEGNKNEVLLLSHKMSQSTCLTTKKCPIKLSRVTTCSARGKGKALFWFW